MPLLTLQRIVLVPEQVLLLQLQHPSIVSMMRKIIEGQRTLGITTSYDSSVGTTAETRSYSEDNDNIGQGLPLIKVKAEADNGLL
jgi:Lon protease-like protein